MHLVVTTNTIAPTTDNIITQLYGVILKQNYLYFNCQYYIKYEVLAMGVQTLIHYMDLFTVHGT
jgi:hypothetical protein